MKLRLVSALLSSTFLLAACADDGPAPEGGGEPAPEAGGEHAPAEGPTAPAGYVTVDGLELKNASGFGDWVFGGQPSEADLATLQSRGITKIIDLRTEAEDRGYDEAAVCAELGLEYRPFPFSPGNVDEAIVDGVLAELEQGGKALVHCASGNRVQLLFSVHRVLHEGVDAEAAIADGLAHGLSDGAATVARQLLETRSE